MFTGIVEELGAVVAVEDLGDAIRLTVRGAGSLEDAGTASRSRSTGAASPSSSTARTRSPPT